MTIPRGEIPALEIGWRAARCLMAGRRRWFVLLLLAGYLLFCHGCHGNEDNELFQGWPSFSSPLARK